MNNYRRSISYSFKESILSERLMSDIVMFRLFGNDKGYIKVDGLNVGDIPATPLNRGQLRKNDHLSESIVLQCASLLGDPIGYVQESGGKLVNNFFPQPTKEASLTSDSCDSELDMHTENAFHNISPDFLILLCLRQDKNKEAITYISSIDKVLEQVSDDKIDYFFNEKYNFLSDYDGKNKNCRVDFNKKQTVLYGDRTNPFFRFDPQFMVGKDAVAERKMNELREVVWSCSEAVLLDKGSLLLIDNRKTCHARSPFTAFFDGQDRWIQRTFSICHKKHIIETTRESSPIYELNW
jgi:L-asparagine oxygenase